MIHIAIYDITQNGQSYSQGLCDFSTGFPTQLKAPVEQVCHRFGDAGRAMQISKEPALRFSAMEDLYILTVICRIPADPQQGIPRSYNRLVNYVMDEEAADEFLAVGNWIAAVDKLLELFGSPAWNQEELLLNGWKAYFGEVVSNPVHLHGNPALAVVLGGCLDAPEKKVRIVQDGPREDYLALEWLMRHLPPRLRHNVRFITNVKSPSEETGICLSFCTSRAVDSMEQSGNQGGELAYICTCRSGQISNYKALQEELETARTVLNASSDSRYFAEQFLRDDQLQTYLTLLQNDWGNSEETLKLLCQVCGEKDAISFLQYYDHGYAPDAIMTMLKSRPKWLKACPALRDYLQQQYGTARKKVVVQGVHVHTSAPRVRILPESVPAKLKEDAEQEPDAKPEKKGLGTATVILLILAAVALLGIIVTMAGGLGFLAAETEIILTVAMQKRIIKLLGTGLFALVLIVCLGLIILPVLLRKCKKSK